MTTVGTSTRIGLMKPLIPLLVIVVLVISGLLLVKNRISKNPHATKTAEVKVGAKVPDTSLQIYNGKATRLSELGAKVILVNFWATWCESCMVEMPSIIRLRNKYKTQGFEVVLINVDERPERVLPRTIRQFGIDFPIYTDTDGALGDIFDVHAIPLTLILDRDRTVLFIETGERDWNGSDIHARVERWLSG
jgi:thiol-disulfide isomerase/thioredoxin